MITEQSALVRVPCPLCGCSESHPERIVRGFGLERCTGCDFVFANPQPPREDVINGYQDRKDPDALIAHYGRAVTRAALAEYDRILDDIHGLVPALGRLYDFGCGSGHFVERASRRGWQAHGSDVGHWVRTAAAARGLTNIRVGTLAEQGYPDGHFDVVHSSQVLEHLQDPRGELAEIRRVLRPGGVFYANVPNYQCLSIVLGRDDFDSNYPMGHVNYFTPRTLRSLLETCQFEVIRTSTYGGLKWENLLGRAVVDGSIDPPDVAKHPSSVHPPASGIDDSPIRRTQPPWKRVVFPFVKGVFYERAQVGMNLEVFARKLADHGGACKGP